ncbi:hypothetical protein ACE7GA_21390 [Roseomonas sp. CCTCC AB2023176]|uniref:hypothetical protein n=1 Tax=Roseomonas sp. CCTCC AB2023176 TaxID=3342640 RepID=UPI0035E1DA0E
MTHAPGWTSADGETWTRSLLGRPGEVPLLLRVRPDPGNPTEPWFWEVVQKDPEDSDAEEEIDVAGSMSAEEAMQAATARALAYRESED